MRPSLLWIGLVSIAAGEAKAQCKSDIECKGDRICVQSQCVEAPPGAIRRAPVPLSSAAQVPRDDWANTAAVMGFSSAAVVMALALGSEATRKDQIPSLPLGAAATVLLGVMAPVVEIGAGSGRAPGETGSGFGWRLTGWFAYGFAMIDALALIGLGGADVPPPAGVIALTGVLGTISLVSFGIDGIVSHQDAEARRATATAMVIRLPDGRTSPALGLRATF